MNLQDVLAGFQGYRTALALANPDFVVAGYSGAVELFAEQVTGRTETRVWDLFPELERIRPELHELLEGKRSHSPWVWVRTQDDGPRLCMIALPQAAGTPGTAGLILVAASVQQIGPPSLGPFVPFCTLSPAQTPADGNLSFPRPLSPDAHELMLAVTGTVQQLITPLTCVLGYQELLLEQGAGPLTSTQFDYLRRSRRNALRTADTLQHLDELCRVQTGQLRLAVSPVEVPDLMAMLSADAGPRLNERAQQLNLVSWALPSVVCDSERVRHAVAILVQNASQYSPRESTIQLSVQHAPEQRAVVLSVTDHGIGIPPEDRERVFLPFARGSNAARSGTGGAGLGLYVSRLLVELQGGRLWCDSSTSSGTTFCISLPCQVGELVTAGTAPGRDAGAAASA